MTSGTTAEAIARVSPQETGRRVIRTRHSSSSAARLRLIGAAQTGDRLEVVRQTTAGEASVIGVSARSGYAGAPPADGGAVRRTGTAAGRAAEIEDEVQRLMAEGRVLAAKAVLVRAGSRGLDSEALARWREVLSPAKVRLREAPRQRRRDREQEWLRQHGGEYRGQWVALDGEVLVAAGEDLRRVIESVRKDHRGGGVLFCQIPSEVGEQVVGLPHPLTRATRC